MGSRHSAEDFGEDGELPPDRADSATCAGVAYHTWGNRGLATMRIWVPTV